MRGFQFMGALAPRGHSLPGMPHMSTPEHQAVLLTGMLAHGCGQRNTNLAALERKRPQKDTKKGGRAHPVSLRLAVAGDT